jgi:putative transposase
VVSDDHEGIKAAVAGELPGVEWQRCEVHFERNVLSSVPASEMSEVAEDLKAVFKVRREKTARALAEEFVELYSKRFPKAVAVFEAGIGDALAYLHYPSSHHAKLRTTNMLERVFKEVKRRTRVVGVFPNETSASTLATEITLRSSEEWAPSPAPQVSGWIRAASARLAGWAGRTRASRAPLPSARPAG